MNERMKRWRNDGITESQENGLSVYVRAGIGTALTPGGGGKHLARAVNTWNVCRRVKQL